MKKDKEAAGGGVFRRLAEQYVEMEGASLREELREMQAHTVTPRMDGKVRRGAYVRRWGTLLAGAAAAAAGLALVLAMPRFFRSPMADPAGASSAAEPAGEPIAFTASLPVNLSVAGSKQDEGQTLYYLRDTGGDDVVMALERGALPDVDGMAEKRINGTAVYARRRADYAMVIFRTDGVTYTLTCRYRLNTLLDAAENMLQG